MRAHFDTLRWDRPDVPYLERVEAVWHEMDCWADGHPNAPACLLKARLHELVAERFEPVVFRHSSLATVTVKLMR